MSHRHYPPAYLRYLKARLRILAKPSIWGTAIFLSVVGLVIREYWSNPDLFARNQNKQVTSVQQNNSSLTDEDKAIAADIDNLPTLYSDLQQGSLPITVNDSKDNQANKSKSVLDVISKQQSAKGSKSNYSLETSNEVPVPKEQNPFVLQAQNLLQFGTFDNGSQFSGVKSLTASPEPIGIGQTSSKVGTGVNQVNDSQNQNSIGSLPAPLNQTANQPLSSLDGTSSSQPNTLGYNSYGGMQPPYTNNLPSQNSSPTTQLNTGTGYVQPTAPNQTLNSSNNLNNAQVSPNQTFSLNTPLNSSTGYTQPNANQPLNSYNNLNSSQALPAQVQTTPATQPVNSAPSNNISPYSSQTLNPNLVPYRTPVVVNNFGRTIWLGSNQPPQSNFSVPPQIPGQYTGGVQSNGYSYP
ncbi:hypothetical protein I8752_12340 [Nostocaceae cyanobacterium CENA369]|uniref:Uncharacterized protein n=1 Tax=Dendronalium phyllosphericum CENA369 TaxID=1725256 RepID=A0A8J7I0M6_9NOST|nr:hypothetical protein [Dendronalium phyllosphericum]MBH8573795.1 hypothetical protein [Dendronalium phyllosphericum CENA369]